MQTYTQKTGKNSEIALAINHDEETAKLYTWNGKEAHAFETLYDIACESTDDLEALIATASPID